jgi:aerobic-type carbon monoxide dehydrogenase small subunit (CoxS/CutS family)
MSDVGEGMTEEPQKGVWQPLPEGAFESDQTMHVDFAARIAELDALAGRTAEPLAAPGHGHTPPPSSEPAEWSIPVVQDPPQDDSGDYSVGTYSAPWTPPAHSTGAPGDEPEQPDPRTHAVPEADADPVPDAGGDPVADPRPVPGDGHSEHPLVSYVLHVNGTDRPVTDAWLGESLLYVLRERLGLAGAKDGCEQGECGACSVQVDGRLVAACLVPAATTAGCEVRTVEGLSADGRPSDVQQALAECGAVQCGFCVPGMAMTVHDLLEGNHAPSELETRAALSGNLCRCSGYRGVLEAVRRIVSERAEPATAEPDASGPRIPHQAGPGEAE